MITWMCDHDYHGTAVRATTNEFTYGGACTGTVRLITDSAGDPVRPCACSCHDAAD